MLSNEELAVTVPPTHPTVPGVTHSAVEVDGTSLHVASAGATGSPVLLVHGFPETWWTFSRLVPLLARQHRVFAVDLRGFGDSGEAGPDHDSSTAAADLHQLVTRLGVGPVHLLGQDVSGAAVVRFAAVHPDQVASLTAVEMGLPGFGLEALGDVTHGGSWHIGVLAAPGVPELLLAGREREFLRAWFPPMTAVPGAVTDADIAEFARTYARPDGWRGAAGLYRSVLTEGADLRALLAAHPLTMPVLAVGAGGGAFTEATMRQVVAGGLTTVQLDGVGHHVALEAPEALAAAVLGFTVGLDQA